VKLHARREKFAGKRPDLQIRVLRVGCRFRLKPIELGFEFLSCDILDEEFWVTNSPRFLPPVIRGICVG